MVAMKRLFRLAGYRVPSVSFAGYCGHRNISTCLGKFDRPLVCHPYWRLRPAGAIRHRNGNYRCAAVVVCLDVDPIQGNRDQAVVG